MKNYMSFLLRAFLFFWGGVLLSPAVILAQAPYCAASASFGCAADRVCSVSFSGCQNLNNSQLPGQDCGAAAYQNYTHLSPPSVCAGGQLLAQIQTVCCSGPGCPPEFAQFIGAWLDFNQDEDFNDPGEFIAATPAPQAAWNLTIPVPAGATCGATRLRIRTRWGGPAFTAAQACNDVLDWGETEDYAVTIISLPAPNSATFSFCQGEAQNIAFAPNNCAASGATTLRWYDSPAGGNLLAAANQYTANLGIGSHTLWVSHYDTLCHCESPRSPIAVNILAAPPALTLASNAPICSSLPLLLTANGAIGAVSWSGPSAWSATGVNVTRAPAEPGVYTAFQTAPNGCVSPAAAINVQVAVAPAQPSALPQSRCGQGSVTFPVAMGAPSGHGVLLYSAATGGAPLAADFVTPFFLETPPLTGNATFYIAAQDTLNQCQSVRIAVEANVFPAPSVPAVNAVSRCGAGSVTLTVTGIAPGEEVRLYTEAALVAPVATAVSAPYELLTPTLTQSATLYIEIAGAGGCVTPKIPAPVTILPNPGIPFSQGVSRCGAGVLTFTVLLDSFLPADEALLYTLPAGGAPIANAWVAPYLLSSPALGQSQTLYIAARNTQTGCESSRLPVNAQIFPLPGAPNIANLERCGAGEFIFTASFQTPVGNFIQMYTQPSGGAPLQTAASGTGYTAMEFPVTLSTNATFYFEAQTSNGCASPRTPAVAAVHPLPAAPETPKVSRCGAGGVIFTPIPAPINSGDFFLLYAEPTGGASISTSATAPYELSLPLVNATQTFWVASRNTATGCESSRAPAIAEVLPLPGSPLAASFSRCGPGVINFSVAMGAPAGGQMQIWDSPLGGNLLAQSLGFPYAFSLNSVTTVTYFLQSVAQPSGCQSSRVPLTLIIHPVPARPDFLPAARCEPGVVTLTALPQNPAQEKVLLYNFPAGGHPINEANGSPFTLATPFLAATSEFYIAAANTQTGCVSARAAVSAQILPAPSQPEVANAVSCGGEPVLLTITMGPVPGNYAALYTVPVGGNPIAIQNAAPYQLQTPAISTHTTFYISAGYQGSSCESPRRIALVQWAAKPSAPQVTPASRCGQGQVVFTAAMGAIPGNIIRAYDQASGGSLISAASASPYLLSVPAVAATTPFWLSAYNTVTGCESPRVSSLAIINLPPAAPISSDIVRCGMGPVQIEAQMGVPAGDEIRLFTVASGGAPIAQDNFAPFSFSMFLPSNQVFYLESRNSITGCVSSRASVVVTLNPVPAAPTVPEAAICGGGAVTFSPIVSSPQADEARLYAGPNGGSLLATASGAPYLLTTPSLSATATFYVSVFNSQTGCESPRSAAVARLSSLPGRPIAEDFIRCGAGEVAIAALAGEPAGDQLALYDSPVGGTLIATAIPGQVVELQNVTASATYYWESRNTQTQCFSQRTPVAITVHPLPTPPAVAHISRCAPGAVTFSPIFLAAANSQVFLYTQSSGGAPIASALQAPYEISLQVFESQTYYFAHYNAETGCQSLRVPAEATVNLVAPPPIAAKVSSCTPSALIFTAISGEGWADLQARLYDLPQGGNIIALSQTPPYLLATPYLTTSQTYYVAFANVLGQCEGPRTPVVAEILPTPPAPVIENEKRCGAGSITFFPSSAQPAVRLYSVEAGGAPLVEDTTHPFELTTGQLEPAVYTYYISAFNPQTGCESPRIAAAAMVYPLPAPPTLENVARCAAGEVIFTAQLADNTQKTVRVYESLTLQNPIAELGAAPFAWKAPSVSTSTEFYFTTYDLVSGCQSGAQSAKAIIEPTPAPVSVADVSRCGPGDVTFSAYMNQPAGNEIRLYTLPVGGAPIQTDASLPYLLTVNDLVNNGSFYFSAYNSATGCEGERVKANAFLAPRPVSPVINARPICGQGSVTIDVTAPGASSVALFSDAVGGNIIAIDYNEPFILLSPYQSATATYYVSVLGGNGCEGERQAVEALVYPNPSTPSVEAVIRCGAGPVAFTVNGAPLGYEAALFSTPLGGAPLALTQAFPYELYLPEVTASATYYIALTDLQTGCSGPRQAAQAEIKPLPGAPPSLTLARCGEGFLSFTAATGAPAGDALFLFSAPNGGAILSSDDNPPYTLQTPYLTESAAFYLEARDSQSGCRSQRSLITIDVLPLPGAPFVLNQSGCAGQSVTFSVNFTFPTGNQILMYAHSSAGLPMQSKSSAPFIFTTPELPITASYYFSARNTVTGCESPRVEAAAIISAPPSPPVVAPVTRCGAGNVTLTAQSALPGNFIARLYADPESAAPLIEKEGAPYELYAPVINRTTTFYVSFMDNLSGCESARVPVTVTVAPVPEAPLLQDAFRCGPGVIRFSLAESIAAGSIVRLFDEEFGGARVAQANMEPYILEAPLTQTSTFYAQALNPVTGCGSARLPVIGEVRNLPGAPASQNLKVCVGASVVIPALMGAPAGQSLRLYIAPNAAAPLAETSQAPYELNAGRIEQNTTFYISSVSIEGCESPRIPVEVGVEAVPASPIAAQPIGRCGPGPVLVTANMGIPAGDKIAIYAQPQGGQELASALAPPYHLLLPNVTQTQTYFIESIATAAGCASLRVPVTVQILRAPGAPAAASVQRCGPGGVAITAAMGAPAGSALRLFDALVGGNLIAQAEENPAILSLDGVSQSVTYYLESYQSANLCASARIPVSIAVVPAPEPPVVAELSICGRGVAVFSPLVPVGNWQLRLYESPAGGRILSQTATLPYEISSPLISQTQVFGISLRDNFTGCESAKVPAKAEVTPAPATPLPLQAFRCGEGPVTFSLAQLLEPNETLELYTSPAGGQALAEAQAPNQELVTPALTQTTTFYIQKVTLPSGCVSERVPALASIFPVPPAPSAVNITRCGQGQVRITATGIGQGGETARLFSEPIGGVLLAEAVSAPYILNTPILNASAVFFLEARNVSGCVSERIPVSVNINPIPAPPALSGNSPICAGQTLTLQATGTPGSVFIWQGPGGFTATSATLQLPEADESRGGAYSVSAILAGCTSAVNNIQVRILPGLPKPEAVAYSDFGGSRPFCQGEELNLAIANFSDFPPGVSFYWSGPAGFASSAPSPVISSLTQIQGGVYSVYAVANGCASATGSVEVIVNPSPLAPVILSNAPVCLNENFTLTATATPGAQQYQWHGPSGFSFSGLSVTRQAAANSAGVYSLTAISAAGCTSALVTYDVQFFAQPRQPEVTHNAPICQGSALAVSVLGSGNYYLEAPAFSQSFQSSSFGRANMQLQEAGVYTIVAIANGCTSLPTFFEVKVNPLPATPIAKAEQPICEGQTLRLWAEDLFSASDYIWSGPNNFFGRGANVNIPNLGALHNGDYVVRAVVEGCTSAPAIVNVSVSPKPAPPSIESSGAICMGGIFFMTISNADPNLEYRWWGPSQFSASGAQVFRTNSSVAYSGLYQAVAIQNGCSSEIGALSIEVRPLPSPPAVYNNGPLCAGAAATLWADIAPEAEYFWMGPNGFMSMGRTATIPALTPEKAGVYSLMFIRNGCAAPIVTTNLVLKPTPAAPIAGSDSPKCAGSTLNLSVSGGEAATYIWRGPAGFAQVGENTTVRIFNVTPAMTGIYTVTAVVDGCSSAPAFVAVNIYSTPSVPFIRHNAPVCEGAALQLSVEAAPGVVYEWSGPQSFSAIGAAVTRSPAFAQHGGTYRVIANNNGCRSAWASANITVTPTPPSPMLNANAPICAGQLLELSAITPGGAIARWEGPNGFAAEGNIASRWAASAADAGNYSAYVVVSNCTSLKANIAVAVIDADEAPQVEASSPICQGQTLRLTTLNAPGAIYHWRGPQGFSSALQNPQIAGVTTAHAGVYQLYLQIGNCFTPPASVSVTVRPAPAPTIAMANAPLCEGQSLRLTATEVPGAAYVWSGPSGFVSSSQYPVLPNVTTANAGVYNVYAIMGGCASATNSVSVQIFRTPVAPTLASSAPLCSGQTLHLTAGVQPNVFYHWRGPNGFFSSSPTPFIENITTAAAGVYSLQVSLGSCTSAVSSTVVQIIPTPSAPQVGSNSPICEGSPLHLIAKPEVGLSYIWQGPAGFYADGPTPFIENANIENGGEYSLVVAAGNCSSEVATTGVEISPKPQGASIVHNAPLCAGSLITLSAPELPNAIYSWSGPAGFQSGLRAPQIPNAQTLHSGVYSLSVQIGACRSEVITANIEVLPAINNLVAAANAPICEGQTLQLQATYIEGAQYIWSGPGGFQSFTHNPVIPNATLAQSGWYSVLAYIGRCSSDSEIRVSVSPSPAPVTLSGGGSVCEGQTANLNALSGDGVVYEWRGPNNFISQRQSVVFENITPEAAGVYSVIAKLGNCALAPATVALQVLPRPVVSSIGQSGAPCWGERLELWASATPGSVLVWGGPNGFSSTANRPVIEPLNLGHSGFYSVQAILSGCTSAVAVAEVNIALPPPSPSLRSNAPLCRGQELRLSAEAAPGASIIWESPEGKRILADRLEKNAELTHSGSWRAWQVLNGCTSSAATLEVRVEPEPNPLTISSNAPICAGATLSLSTDFISGATYEWRGPNGFYSETLLPLIPNAQLTNAGLYSVRAKVGNCYSPVAELFVPIRPQPAPPTVLSNSPICEGETLQLQAIVAETEAQNPFPVFYWTGAGGFAAMEQNPQLYNVTQEASGVYSVAAILGNCTSEAASVAVQVLPTPANLTAGSNSALCEGQTLALSASAVPGATYIWQGPGGFTSMEQNPILWNVTTAEAGVYSVTAHLGKCRSQVAVVPVTIWPAPSAVRAMNNGPLCAGQGLQLSASFVPGATYEWRGPLGFFSNELNPILPNATPEMSGVYSVSARIGSCSAPLAVTQAVIEAAPTLSTAFATSPLCAGQTLTLSVNPQPGATYTWFGPAGFSANGAEARLSNIQTLQAGVYSVTARLGNCETLPVSVTVEVENSALHFTLPEQRPVCQGDTIQIAAPHFANARYLWTGPEGILPEGNPLTLPNVGLEASGAYTLRIVQGSCTSKAVSVNVTVLPAAPAPSIAHNGPVCKGARLTLSALAQEGFSYLWKSPSGARQSGSLWEIEPATAQAAGVYSLQAIGVNGCPSRAATANVVVRGADANFMLGDEAICEEETAWLEVAFEGEAPFNLTYQENGVLKGITSMAPFWALPVTPSQTTVYRLHSVTDASGCVVSLSATKVITVHQTPTVRLYDPGFACWGETGYIPIEVSGIGNNVPWSLVYQEAGALKTFSGVGNGFFEFPTSPVTAPLAIELIAITNTEGDCPRVFNDLRTTLYPRETPSATLFSAGKKQCPGQTVSMPLNVTGQGPWVIGALIDGVQQYLYAGTMGQNGPILLNLPFSFERSTTVILNSIQDGNGCSSSISGVWEVEVLASPKASFVGDAASICAGDTLQLSLNLEGKGPFRIAYTLNGIALAPWQIGSAQSPSLLAWDTVITPGANRLYRLTQVTDSEGCSAALNSVFEVKVLARPQANVVSLTPAGCRGGSVTASAFAEGATSLVYRLGGQENTDGIFTQLPAGVYTLSASNGACSVEQTVTIPALTISGLTLSGLSGGAATLGWNAVSGVDGYNVLYRAKGQGGNWQSVPVAPGGNSAQITGLAAGVTYEFSVQPVCANGSVLPVSAVIEGAAPENEPCPGPQNFAVHNVSANSAVVSWTGNGFGDVCYILAYGPSSENPLLWNEILVPGGITQTFLSGLLPGVNYGVRVKTNCTMCSRLGGLQSAWAGALTFTTLPLRESVESNAMAAKALVYPNPTSGDIYIEYAALAEGALKVELTDLAGRTVFLQEAIVTAGSNLLPFSFELPSGIYLLTLMQGESKLHFRLQIH